MNGKTVQEMICEMLAIPGVSKELLAHRFGVNTRSVYRWSRKEGVPSPAARNYITQVYNGYMAKKGSQ